MMLRCIGRSLVTHTARAASVRPSLSRSSFVLSRSFSSGDLPDHEILPMPALSPTMTEGNLASWTVKEGEEVSAGDAICEIETDKATVAFETTDDGFIAKILVADGTDNVAVGTPVAVLVEDEADVAAFANFVPAESDTAPAPPTSAQEEAPAAPAAPAAKASSHGRVPSIKFRHGNRSAIAERLRSAASSKPTLTAAAPPAAAPSQAQAAAQTPAPSSAAFTDQPASNMRKIIASRLAESKSTIPHFYVTQECDITELGALRARLAKIQKFSVNDCVIRASALALRDVSCVNRSFDETSGSSKQNQSVDISVAVATEGGLITPIVTNADQKTVGQIGSNVRELAGKAKAGTLAAEEYQGGSFTISNLGMFGIDLFSAVINPPQGVIMAVGAGATKLRKDPETGKPVPRTIMTVKLSCDRRVVDEAQAAQMLQTFRHYIQTPELMLL